MPVENVLSFFLTNLCERERMEKKEDEEIEEQ